MTNGAAIGYALLALKMTGILLTDEGRGKFEAAMRSEMDFTTEEEAEEAYNKN